MSESPQTPMKSAVRDAVSEQIKHEFYSAYLYLSMAGSLRWPISRGLLTG